MGDPRMWKKHYSAGTDALRKNDYATATAAFNLALADSENFTGREAYKRVETLSELGHMLMLSREYDEAVLLLKQALELWTAAESNKEVERGGLLMELASACAYSGNNVEAARFALEGIKIFENKVGRYKPTTALAKGELAWIYRGMKKFPEAEQLFLESLKTVQSPQYRTTMEPNGEIRMYRARPVQSQIADIQNNFAGMYQDWGKWDKAESLFKESLSSEEAEFGKEHLNTLTPLSNLTLLNFRRGNLPKAEAYAERAVRVAGKTIGLNQAQGFATLSRLTAIYYRAGNRAAFDTRVAQIRGIEKADPARPLLPWVMQSAAIPESEKSDWAGVEKIYKEFLPEFPAIYGADDPRARSGLETLQKFYASHGRKEDSDKLYAELLVQKAKENARK
ncbi:MAG: Tetratricopeptide 1 repeat-containing protein [Verrucomicrobiales bacterium]|nr:Tetratricopeptide 1 repeat-containing protein [Verrucomicrobiales bacterium]